MNAGEAEGGKLFTDTSPQILDYFILNCRKFVHVMK